MSKLARALVLAATVAAMNLAGMAAIAQAQAGDEATPSQQELADRWAYYHQSTQIPPAELKARMQADAAQRAPRAFISSHIFAITSRKTRYSTGMSLGRMCVRTPPLSAPYQDGNVFRATALADSKIVFR